MSGKLQDKTLWANITALVAALAGYFTGQLDLGTAVSGGVIALMNIVTALVKKAPVATPPAA